MIAPWSTLAPMMTPQLYGQQLAMNSTKNVKVLPFDKGPPKVLVLSYSSLEHLPFDCGPNHVLTLYHVNENSLSRLFIIQIFTWHMIQTQRICILNH